MNDVVESGKGARLTNEMYREVALVYYALVWMWLNQHNAFVLKKYFG